MDTYLNRMIYSLDTLYLVTNLLSQFYQKEGFFNNWN